MAATARARLDRISKLGAGSRMIDTAIIRLGYWTGKLQPKPAAADAMSEILNRPSRSF